LTSKYHPTFHTQFHIQQFIFNSPTEKRVIFQLQQRKTVIFDRLMRIDITVDQRCERKPIREKENVFIGIRGKKNKIFN